MELKYKGRLIANVCSVVEAVDIANAVITHRTGYMGECFYLYSRDGSKMPNRQFHSIL